MDRFTSGSLICGMTTVITIVITIKIIYSQPNDSKHARRKEKGETFEREGSEPWRNSQDERVRRVSSTGAE